MSLVTVALIALALPKRGNRRSGYWNELVRFADISNNVGPVKSFLSVLLPPLQRVVFLVLLDLRFDDHGSLVIFRSASVRPKHLFDPYLDHDY
jgi:hypothetical protein